MHRDMSVRVVYRCPACHAEHYHEGGCAYYEMERESGEVVNNRVRPVEKNRRIYVDVEALLSDDAIDAAAEAIYWPDIPEQASPHEALRYALRAALKEMGVEDRG